MNRSLALWALALMVGIGGILSCGGPLPEQTVTYHPVGAPAQEVPVETGRRIAELLVQAVEQALDRQQLLVTAETIEGVRGGGAVEVLFTEPLKVRPGIGPTLVFDRLLLGLPLTSTPAPSASLPQVMFWGEGGYSSGPLALSDPQLPVAVRAILDEALAGSDS